MPMSALCAGPARAARDGFEINPMQGYLVEILGPILAHQPEGQAIYAPSGSLLQAGETIRLPELGDLLERLGDSGPDFLYRGEVARLWIFLLVPVQVVPSRKSTET